MYFYRYGADRPAASMPINKRTYLGSVKLVQLNHSHAAVLSDRRVLLHPIEMPPGVGEDEYDMMLPPPGQAANISCVALTDHFLITGTTEGGKSSISIGRYDTYVVTAVPVCIYVCICMSDAIVLQRQHRLSIRMPCVVVTCVRV